MEKEKKKEEKKILVARVTFNIMLPEVSRVCSVAPRS